MSDYEASDYNSESDGSDSEIETTQPQKKITISTEITSSSPLSLPFNPRKMATHNVKRNSEQIIST